MTATFECKLKGRLGTGDNDMKEMRVLNRIVRITPDGLLYEADPRHAEMLIKAFKLEDSKPVVTPGVKPSDPEPDPDKLDHEVAEEIHAIISSLSPSKCRRSRFHFALMLNITMLSHTKRSMASILALSTLTSMEP